MNKLLELLEKHKLIFQKEKDLREKIIVKTTNIKVDTSNRIKSLYQI